MSSDLRSKIIRLAAAKPELQPHLLPLMKAARGKFIQDDVEALRHQVQGIEDALGDAIHRERGNLSKQDIAKLQKALKYLKDSKGALFEAQEWLQTINPTFR